MTCSDICIYQIKNDGVLNDAGETLPGPALKLSACPNTPAPVNCCALIEPIVGVFHESRCP